MGEAIRDRTPGEGADGRPPGGLPRNLVVTYHYVRERNSDGVTGVTPGRFRRQVEAIGRRYEIVTAPEWDAFAATTDGLALITFDDAVRDQHEVAFPILEDLAAPCVVFTPMRPYAPDPARGEDAWITQHLLHALAQELGWEELEGRVRGRIGDPPVDGARMDALYHYEEPRKRRLKFLMAFALPPERAGRVLRAINDDPADGPRLRAGDWFAGVEGLREMQAAGHAIGGHGFDHLPYSEMTPKQEASDMQRALAAQSALFGAMPRPLALPFGRASARTRGIARSLGYTSVFGTAERVDAKDLDALLGIASEDDARAPRGTPALATPAGAGAHA